MARAKSEDKMWLNYIVQPFARQFFYIISSVHVVASKEWHFFFSLKHL